MTEVVEVNRWRLLEMSQGPENKAIKLEGQEESKLEREEIVQHELLCPD